MKIRRLRISRFRCLETFEWSPKPGLNCLIGPGDVGKSTVLNAIALLLAPYPQTAASEFDYFKRGLDQGFEIEACIGQLDLARLAGERQLPPLQGWVNGQVVPLPDENGAEPALVCRVRGTSDMEIVHEILNAAGEAYTFSVGLRRKMAFALLAGDERTPRDLRLSPGSVLDRYLGRPGIRPALHRAIADASANMQVPTELVESMDRLRDLFRRARLPTDLRIGIVPSLGTSLAGTAALMSGANAEEAIPVALAGSGTRNLALIEIAAGMSETAPIVLVDEPEKGLEPYRQELLCNRIGNVVGEDGQAFISTHASGVLQCMPRGAVWRVGSVGPPACLEDDQLTRLLEHDPNAFFARLPVVCEGDTEVGLLAAYMKTSLPYDFAAAGIHLVDGRGQPDALRTLEAFLSSGMTCAGFVDNEENHSGLRDRIGRRCVLAVWGDAKNIEEAVAKYLPADRLGRIIQWAAESKETEERYLII